MIRRMFTPIRALEETADALNAGQVDMEALRRLAERLDEITVSSLKTSRIQIPAGPGGDERPGQRHQRHARAH